MKRWLGKFALLGMLLLITNAVVMAGAVTPTGNILSVSCDNSSVTLTYNVNALGGQNLLIAILYRNGGGTIENIPDSSTTATVQFTQDDVSEVLIGIGSDSIGLLDFAYVRCDGHYSVFRDGRINNYDAAAPVAVYPATDANGAIGLEIYDIDGILILSISAEQLAAAIVNPDSPVLIAESLGAALYLLPDGSWQINAPQYNGKIYVMIFTELYPNAGYTSYEIEP